MLKDWESISKKAMPKRCRFLTLVSIWYRDNQPSKVRKKRPGFFFRTDL
jgi:hypothetical protein